MITKGLYVRLEAKPGKEHEVERFLHSALPLVEAELFTTAWFAIRMSPTVFGIFDVFPDEEGRRAHLSGKVAQALQGTGCSLFALAGFGLRVGGWPAQQNLTEENFYDAT